MSVAGLRTERSVASAKRAGAMLLGIGTAVPAYRASQSQSAERLAAIWKLQGPALERWRRIIAGSGIEHRHGAMAVEDVAHLTTAQRMQAYEQLAPPLAERAAETALASAGADRSAVTDLIVVSCTGFAAPGLDVALIERLGLPLTTRRTAIGFMGCFGAINGLRIASGLCAADSDAVALVVCCELCSLHVRNDLDPQNLVASALFADGAAAAVLAGDKARDAARSAKGQRAAIGCIGRSSSLLMPEGRDWMTWRITDAGFAMTLNRQVPVALEQRVMDVIDDLDEGDHAALIVHPGGPGVLDAVERALNLRDGPAERGIVHARQVLRDFGNMSSCTALFVLEHALRSGVNAPAMLLAFGPGLTIEGVRIGRASA